MLSRSRRPAVTCRTSSIGVWSLAYHNHGIVQSKVLVRKTSSLLLLPSADILIAHFSSFSVASAPHVSHNGRIRPERSQEHPAEESKRCRLSVCTSNTRNTSKERRSQRRIRPRTARCCTVTLCSSSNPTANCANRSSKPPSPKSPISIPPK